MDTKCALPPHYTPPYPSLNVIFLEETKLLNNRLPKYFNEYECKLIMELLKRYMGDGFIFLPLKLNFENFQTCLNNMHASNKVTFEKQEMIYKNEKKVQVLDLFDAKILLHEDNVFETDIFCKLTITHDYLPYDSAHPDHTKNNIPYNLVERIIVFIYNSEKVIIHLDQLKFLKVCKYLEHVISKSIFNAKHQIPLPNPKRNKNAITFVTTYYPNIDNKSLMQNVKKSLKI